MSYGENQNKGVTDVGFRSIHAEDNAIRKLPIQPRNKRLKKVDLLVVRINRGGSLGNSKPCVHCLLLLSEKLPDKGYQVANVYYSTSNGTIAETKLKHLLAEPEPHFSRFYRDRNLYIRKSPSQKMLGATYSYSCC